MEEKRQSLKEYIKDFIIDRLEDHSGTHCDPRELANEITASINCDGSATYSTYEAKQYIKHWFEECGDFVTYYNDNFGEGLYNPFEEPERFHCSMIIFGVENVLSQLDCLEDAEDFELTNELIKAITEELESTFHNFEVF